MAKKHGEGNFSTRGRGMFRGINCVSGELADKITRKAFQKGLIIETSGAEDHIVKIFCPLIITEALLKEGMDILEQSVAEICGQVDEIPEEHDFFSEAS